MSVRTLAADSIRAGSPFFSKDTMRFYGDRLANFRTVDRRDDCIVFERVARGTEMPVDQPIGERYRFDRSSGQISLL